MSIKIAYIGCVKMSDSILQSIFKNNKAQITGIVTKKESNFNSDFLSLEKYGLEKNIPVHISNSKNDEEFFLKSLNPDVIFCFGWSKILSSTILSIPRLGCIGYHPTCLPSNRGRHPIIWTIALGLDKTASTFFKMDSSADSGPILSQKIIQLEKGTNASKLYSILTENAIKQVKKIIDTLDQGDIKFNAQPKEANSWRLRNEEDGKIDWRMTADAIQCLVNSLSHPYLGAHCIYGQENVKIWEVEIGPYFNDNIEPGKILSNQDGKLLVKCWKGSVKILDHNFSVLPEVGVYI